MEGRFLHLIGGDFYEKNWVYWHWCYGMCYGI